MVNTVKIGGKPIKLDKVYRIAFHGFIGGGGDGFTIFRDC